MYRNPKARISPPKKTWRRSVRRPIVYTPPVMAKVPQEEVPALTEEQQVIFDRVEEGAAKEKAKKPAKPKRRKGKADNTPVGE